jgi:hypothetical protein
MDRAEQHLRRGEIALDIRVDLRDTEIEHDGSRRSAFALGEEDVARLEIAMHDAGVVSSGDGGDHRQHQIDELLERDPPPLRDLVREIVPLEQLHDEVRHAVVRADVEHRDDVRVLDARRGPSLSEKARRGRLARREVRVERLDGDALAEILVLPLVHRRHRALADLATEPVGA